jgi:hypothetical protein
LARVGVALAFANDVKEKKSGELDKDLRAL